MTTEVRVPALGESVTEATIATWFKKPGDRVEVDEMLCELETDKVTVEVPSPAAGTLAEIVAAEGETVGPDALLAQISEGGEAAAPAPKPAKAEAPAEKTEEQKTMSGNSVDVMVPSLGESVTEATVATWFKKVGDTVEVDEPLLEVSTDKVDTEIPSPVAGVLTKIVAQEDDTVEIGGELAQIGDAGEKSAPAEESESAAEEPAAEEPTPAAEPEPQAEEEAPTQEAPAAKSDSSGSGTPVKMPELGESVHEGTVSRWLKAVGDAVKEDEPIVEIMTDKVNTELPSPAAGILTEILIKEGDPVKVFEAMGVTPPAFTHAALLTGAEGKLSKRLGSLGVDHFREAGIEPAAVVSLLARIGTSDPVEPFADVAPLIEGVDFARFGRAPARFDEAELALLQAGPPA